MLTGAPWPEISGGGGSTRVGGSLGLLFTVVGGGRTKFGCETPRPVCDFKCSFRQLGGATVSGGCGMGSSVDEL
ncbi:hypothetical protein PanWU01x14_002710 [Parasponia andersonii]|uniref:Uncharacterized protein n=1 Tax=Parasponia andersonii TaxID=3476 RepID=A0A2P5E584_PARAD|nr:hypothetical protein PanWU01x14_002710 [Parasponia andersonii]